MRWRGAADAVVTAGLAAAYVGTARLGLSLAFVAEQVTAVWPPTGIALAAVLLLGRRAWPGIALGAFLANLPLAPPLAAAGIALGNTLEAVVGAWLLHRVAQFNPALERVRDAVALAVLGAGLSTVVSATLGVTSLCLAGLEAWSDFGRLWGVWWLGDATGDLLVAPLLLGWVKTPPRHPQPRRLAEASALAGGVGTVCLLVFSGPFPRLISDHPLEYTVFPFVIWAALRFGQPGTATIIALAAALAITGTVRGHGPFATGSPHEGLILLQTYMGIVAATGLVLAAATAQRRVAERRRAAEYAVTGVLAGAATPAEAAPGILRAVCENLRWSLGALWTSDPSDGMLRCVEIWHQPWVEAPNFQAKTRALAFPRGVGLPGRVWVSARPAWIPDLAADTNFPRAPQATREGLQSAFAFPILLGNEVLGVMEFFTHQRQEPDADLLAMSMTLGSQVGQFLERKRAEESLRESESRLRLALDAGRMGVWDWDVDSGAVRWWGNLEAIHGVPPGTFGGTFEAFRQLIHPDDRPHVEQAISKALAERTTYDIEFRVIWQDGSVHWVAGKGRVFCDGSGRAVRMLGVGLDVTELRRLAEELRQRVEQLAAADRRKDEFLATLAHELRNPLAPLRSALEAIRLQWGEDPMLTPLRTLMERQVATMTRLVDDLLDVSRITRGRIELHRQRVDLAAVVRRAVETTQPLLQARGHQLEVTLPEEAVLLEADPTRLEQLLANLLNNAAKYTDAGGRITLRAECTGQDVILRVRDTGIGIRPELLPRIFELFTQGDHLPDRFQEGLGIGLTLVRRLAELHGGSVSAHSAGPGQGSEFVVRLPRARDSCSPAPAPAREAVPSGAGRSILLVDDNADAAHSLALVLRLWGHEVRLAADGPAALEEARGYRPEVILLDIGLPKGMTGYDVARRLQQEGLAPSLLIALTGYGQEDDHRRSREAGFDHHLVKPVDPEELLRLLETGPTESLRPG